MSKIKAALGMVELKSGKLQQQDPTYVAKQYYKDTSDAVKALDDAKTYLLNQVCLIGHMAPLSVKDGWIADSNAKTEAAVNVADNLKNKLKHLGI